MIEIKRLSKSYNDTAIVNNLNLKIPTGSIFGFLGPNGAGKTTTIKMLVGLNSPDAGTIKINGKEISNLENRQSIGFMPEDPYFYDNLTAVEFLTFMANLFSSVTCNIDRLLKTVGLEQSKNQSIGQFSKGMKQRLGLAQAMVNDPNYLFLDEPLDGLDPIGRREFKQILLNQKMQGKTIFFNSHILSDVEEICDQIGIINQGELIYSGPVNKFRKNNSLEDAFVEAIANQSKAVKSKASIQ